jgi:5'-phosphate synthase pdxT subunit
LALQGAFKEHAYHVKALGHEALEVRTEEELNQVDAIILPGGESTVIGKLLRDFELLEPLVKRIDAGLPVWGTCAGMILLAQEIEGTETSHLGTMEIGVRRNAYGRQLGSFIVSETIPAVSKHPMPLVFIRAPLITTRGPSVEVLHQVNGHIVAARQNHMLVTSFHPELTDDTSFLNYFINMIP